MSTDAELLQRYVRENSEAAFAELVRRHLSLVYSAALRQVGGDAHLAQDVAQTVFTALARKAAALTGRAALAGWLYLGAHHAAAQAVRGERRRHTREQEAHTMQQLFAATGAATDWDRVRPALDDAMRALNDADREAVLLRYFERRPFADIGTALHLSEDAARMRVERALEKLRALLGRRGITSTATALAAVLGSEAMVAAPAGLATAVTGAALAGAAGGAGLLAATTGFFMNTTHTLVTAIAFAALGATAFQTVQAHRADAALAAAVQDRDALQTQLRAAQQRTVQSDRRSAALQGELDAARAGGPVAPPATTKVVLAAPAAPDRRQLEEIAIKGQVQPQMRSAVRTAETFDANYRAFRRQLGFSAAQGEQLTALLVADMNRRNELVAGLKTPAELPFQELDAQARGEFRAAVRNTFGEATLQALEHFQATSSLRSVADKLAVDLFYSDTPLNATQADQLVDILAVHSRNAQGNFDLAALNAEAVNAQAQVILAPAQLAALRQLEAQIAARRAEAPKLTERAGGVGAGRKPGS